MQYLIKRTLDFVFAGLGLLFLSPFFVLVSLLIYLDNPGPVFFFQKRVGYKGKLFYIVKFRTMVVNAEALLASIENLNQSNGVLFKVDKDPRITRVGKFLRNYSIDELPQLINILKGELSFIGPRPLSIRDCERMPHFCQNRTEVLPGLSGIWQTYGKKRWELSVEQIYKLDRYYIDNWSLLLDFKILVKTIIVVLTKNGTC